MKKETTKTEAKADLSTVTTRAETAVPAAPAKPKYVMTAEDEEALRPLVENTDIPGYTMRGDALAIDHPMQKVGMARIARAMGITDADLYSGAIQQLLNISQQGAQADVTALNFAISLVRGLAPRDHLETMLAIQMTAVHLASIRHVRMMNHAANLDQLDIQERTTNKLMRTFTTQMEALRAEASERRKPESHREACARQRRRPGHHRQCLPWGEAHFGNIETIP